MVNERMISFTYFQIGVIQAVAGFFSYFSLFNDYGHPPALLPQLDSQNYYAANAKENAQWLVASRDDFGKKAFNRSWFDSDVGVFTSEIQAEGLNVGYFNLTQTPEAGKTGNLGFRTIVGIIGSTLKMPPCLAYSCGSNGSLSNDFEICIASGSISSADLFGIDDGTSNPNVLTANASTRKQPGYGCFELWSYEQQDLVQKQSQLAYFITIIVTQYFHAMICKTRVLSFFEQGMWNWWLNASSLAETLLAVGLAYLPFLRSAFGTVPIPGPYWLTGLPFAVYLFVYDKLRKFIMRRGIDHGNKFGLWVMKFTYW